VTLFTLNLLRAQGVKTSHWFYEDFRLALYWKSVISGYDYFFAIQKGPLPEACAQAGSAYFFLPTAAGRRNCAECTAAEPTDRPYDVAFIGVPSPYRIKVLEHLAALGFSLCIAGFGWDRYSGPLKSSIVNAVWTDVKQAADLLRASKSGVNLSVFPPDADRQNTQISPRVFDLLASGCVLVTEDVPLAAETLKNLHYHVFMDKEEAGRRIIEILADGEREKKFFDPNRAAICREHTYANRAKEIIACCSG
jgi:glycosyltransferase involved in cell wall biosynthesis